MASHAYNRVRLGSYVSVRVADRLGSNCPVRKVLDTSVVGAGADPGPRQSARRCDRSHKPADRLPHYFPPDRPQSISAFVTETKLYWLVTEAHQLL